MSVMPKSPTKVVGGRISRRLQADPTADLTDLQQDLAEARIAEAAERVLADAPPLRPEQIDRITAIFRSGGASK